MEVKEQVSAKVSGLLRRPVSDVFSAFVDPEEITRFWLSSSSGALEVGKTVRWDFMVPGATVEATTTALEVNKLISVSWSDGTYVEWNFTPHKHGTYLQIENGGFRGSEREIVKAALEATQGFTIVLCDLKMLLETGRQANLTRDKAILIEEGVGGSTDT